MSSQSPSAKNPGFWNRGSDAYQGAHGPELEASGVRLALVHGDAERAPFASASFDLIFCDHGAMSFVRPEPAVAEAARLLRPGGLFALCMASRLRDLCWDPALDRVDARLAVDHFDLFQLHDDDSICHQLPYGAWKLRKEAR
jgi:SAM-dependent methyltransferase